MPAPWALAAPAGEHSSSPRRAHEPVGERGAPVFRYTTSEFDDAPSLRLSLGGASGAGGIEDDGDETLKGLAPPARLDGPAQAHNAAPAGRDEDMAEIHPVSPDRASSSSSATAPRPRRRARPRPRPVPTSFSASSMPPRVARPAIDEPLDDGPPSDEDPFGYALRTTGTFSSEDDLPDSAPSDESALEDYLAEREVGRAVKPTSGQRDKRVAASARARRLRLVEGAREGLERNVLDVGEAHVGDAVRRLMASRAEGADEQEEEEALEAWRRQKRKWMTSATRR